MFNVCDDNITNLSFRYIQKCLHLFMQSFTDSEILTLYYYGVKSEKVTHCGQQRRKGASKLKACCNSFFDPLTYLTHFRVKVPNCSWSVGFEYSVIFKISWHWYLTLIFWMYIFIRRFDLNRNAWKCAWSFRSYIL